jgi:uridylate kinase
VIYKRILLKLSGEVLAGGRGFGIEAETLDEMARQIHEIHDAGLELAVVIGGGNIFRGLQGIEQGTERATGDYMGMLATVINACSMQDALERRGCKTRVLSALTIRQVAEPYVRRRAVRHLEKGRVVLLAAGTGNPYFTTDTAAALRACELGAEAVLKATKVRGVFTKDPVKHADAEFLPRLSYQRAIEEKLRVMDTSAISLCQENDIPIHVFDVGVEGNILSVLKGDDIGSVVSKGVNP